MNLFRKKEQTFLFFLQAGGRNFICAPSLDLQSESTVVADSLSYGKESPDEVSSGVTCVPLHCRRKEFYLGALPSTCQSETTIVADSLSLWNHSKMKCLQELLVFSLCSWPGLISSASNVKSGERNSVTFVLPEKENECSDKGLHSKMMDRPRTWVLLDFDSSRIVGTCFFLRCLQHLRGGKFIYDPSDLSRRDDRLLLADSLSLWNRLIKYLPGVLVFLCAAGPASYPSAGTVKSGKREFSDFCFARERK
ncbi:hypothetical protein CEXT_429641 [Caerostris extrusa]|uniref:Uncharacterized protein n=1 Tax=Caerostris extrusa TaxID=172846 RepID=A0AAV4WMZ0_CAEEX|nr:hypothetical protein CEXT_429641 [Caerostris extrusa]